MDKCVQCGQVVGQVGYQEKHDEYTCSECLKKQRREARFAKHGWSWPLLLVWDRLVVGQIIRYFVASEVFLGFVKTLSNEVGEFNPRWQSKLPTYFRLDYTNAGGKVTLFVYSTTPEGASITLRFNKFRPLWTMKIVGTRGGQVEMEKLIETLEEVLKSDIEFDEFYCHCR